MLQIKCFSYEILRSSKYMGLETLFLCLPQFKPLRESFNPLYTTIGLKQLCEVDLTNSVFLVLSRIGYSKPD